MDVSTMVEGAQTWVENAITRGKAGFQLLVANFQQSRQIQNRKKAGETISYAEFMVLDAMNDDKGKLLSLLSSLIFFPSYFPIMLVMNPALLPSTFEDPDNWEERHAALEAQRLAAVAGALAQVEEEAFGKERRARARARRLRGELRELLGRAGDLNRAFDALEGRLALAPGKKPSKNPDLANLPKPLFLGLVKGLGLSKQFYPRFALGPGLNAHFKKVAGGDEVLLAVPLEGLSRRELLHACAARAIGGMAWSDEQLRQGLDEYLDVVYAEESEGLDLATARAAAVGCCMVLSLRENGGSTAAATTSHHHSYPDDDDGYRYGSCGSGGLLRAALLLPCSSSLSSQK